jgi:acyl-CoA thioester hydrolase
MGLESHDIQVRVRYAETDAMGILHHANYLVFFEMGRTELYRASGGNYREMEEQGLFFVVVEMRVKYRAPAKYDDLLTVRTKISRITPVKLEHDYEIYRDTQLLASAHSVLACIDREGKVRRIPDFILNGQDS